MARPRSRPRLGPPEPAASPPPVAKDYPYNELRRIEEAFPGETTVLHVRGIAGTEYELLHILGSLALPSAKKQQDSGECADWVIRMHDIFGALYLATGAISINRVLHSSGKSVMEVPNADALLLELQAISLRYTNEYFDRLREHAKLPVKHVDRVKFRSSVLEQVRRIPSIPRSWGPTEYIPVAELLQTGSYLFPSVEKQTATVLAHKLHKKLGPTFFNKVTDEHDRARRLLMAAGVPEKKAWNFVKGAESKQRSRAKRGTVTKVQRKPTPDKPPRQGSGFFSIESR